MAYGSLPRVKETDAQGESAFTEAKESGLNLGETSRNGSKSPVRDISETY
jgi:hypothetical protein